MTNNWIPITEMEKLTIKRKLIQTAERLKLRYIDYGSYVVMCIPDMQELKWKDNHATNKNTAEAASDPGLRTEALDGRPRI